MVLIAKFLVLALTAAATPILRRDATTVQNDITQKIGSQMTKLNNDLLAFPASGSSGASTINSDVQELVSTVKVTISDIKNTGSFSILTGTSILTDINNQFPTLEGILIKFVNSYKAWKAIPGGADLLRSNLQSLKAVFLDFHDAVIEAEPLLLKAGAITSRADYDWDFTGAIAACSV